jgi:hypothetical protein
MAGKGGYQRPTNPAVSSGPGALAQRTDGGPASKQAARYMSGGEYGDGQELMNIQQSAPMEAAPKVKAMSPDSVAETASLPQVTPIHAPSTRPYEPVTTGVNVGAGAGEEVLPAQVGVQGTYNTAYDLIQNLAQNPYASPTMQYLAQRIGQAF